jgi:prevent-host-death family protein
MGTHECARGIHSGLAVKRLANHLRLYRFFTIHFCAVQNYSYNGSNSLNWSPLAMKALPAREAKNQLGAAIDAAQQEAVIITKHGRPVAGLVSIAELAQIPRYRKDLTKKPGVNSEETGDRVNEVLRWYGALKGVFGSADEIDAQIRKGRSEWDR